MGAKLNPFTGKIDLVNDVASETDPLSLHLDQTTPQTFINLGGGTGLMKVTAGLLGLDTNTYLTTESDTLDIVLGRGDTSAARSITLTAGTLTAEQVTSTDDADIADKLTVNHIGEHTASHNVVMDNITLFSDALYLTQIDGAERIDSSADGYVDIFSGTVVGINNTSAVWKATNGGVDLSSGGMSLVIGGDSDATTRTNATTKYGRIAMIEYTNLNRPLSIFYGAATQTLNTVAFGGGNGAMNSATNVQFYTGATNNTATGTKRLEIVSDGEIQIPVDGTAGAAGALSFGAGQDAYILFDSDSMNLVANAVTATDSMEFTAGSYKFQTSTDTDLAITFSGTTNSGVLTWMEDEDQFKFSDRVQTDGGRIGKITTATDTYNILTSDETVLCNKSSEFTLTLPTASTGQMFHFKNIGTGVAVIDGAGTDTIDGVPNYRLNPSESVTIQCSAANTWRAF